jgi:hypothetical protein
VQNLATLPKKKTGLTWKREEQSMEGGVPHGRDRWHCGMSALSLDKTALNTQRQAKELGTQGGGILEGGRGPWERGRGSWRLEGTKWGARRYG